MFCPHCGRKLIEEWLGPGPEPESKKDIHPVCPDCKYVHTDGPVPVAVVMVLDGDRVLLVRPPGIDVHVLVAGFLERFETVEEAAVREVREETGLDVEIEYVLGTYSGRGRQANQVVVTCVARMLGGELSLQASEIAEAAWFGLDNLPDWPHAWGTAQMFADLRNHRV